MTPGPAPPPADRRRRRVVRGLLIFAGLATLLGLIVLIVDPFAPALSPGSDPDAYRALVGIAESLDSVEQIGKIARDGETEADDLARLVEANRERLDRAHEILKGQPGATPEPGQQGVIPHMAELGQLKTLARLFTAEARLAQLRGHPDESVRAALNGLAVARSLGRNGLLGDYLAAYAVESGANAALAEALDACDDATLARLEAELDAFEGGRESIEIVIARDRNFMRRTNSPVVRIVTTLAPGIFAAQVRTALDAARMADLRTRTYTTLLRAEAAIRRYRLRFGHDPATLADLVPEFLPETPADPCGQGALIYLRTGDGRRLYSIGPDGGDDRGMPLPARADWSSAIGDARLDDLSPAPSDNP